MVFQNHSHPHWPVPLPGGRCQVPPLGGLVLWGREPRQPVPSAGGGTLETRCGSLGCLWAVMEARSTVPCCEFERDDPVMDEQQFLFFLSLFLAALCLCCCAWAFSSRGEWGLLSSCGVRASHRGDFSS